MSPLSRLIPALGLGLGLVCVVASGAAATETVFVCDIYGNHVVRAPARNAAIAVGQRCPGDGAVQPPSTGGLALWAAPAGSVRRGTSLGWVIRAPAGLTIASVYSPHMYSFGLNDHEQWAGEFFWGGGTRHAFTYDGETTWNTNSGRSRWPGRGSRYFGWRIFCWASSCDGGGRRHWLTVELLELTLRETASAWISGSGGLWSSSGWIRGDWPLAIVGNSPTGICSGSAKLGTTTTIPGSSFDLSPDQERWHQCGSRTRFSPTGGWTHTGSFTVHTADSPSGVTRLTTVGVDAAGKRAVRSRRLKLDNRQAAVGFAGAHFVRSASGMAHLWVRGSAGPSGVYGTVCSIDHRPYSFARGRLRRLTLAGAGRHSIRCAALNNALDVHGLPGSSPLRTWTLTIRVPTVLRAWVLRPGRNGRLSPAESIRVPFGHGATVHGWLGSSHGFPLRGGEVAIYTKVNNGSAPFRRAGTARTDSRGRWSFRLRPGPSRIVEAWFPGSAGGGPSASRRLTMIVPASVSLSVRPHAAHWGGTIVISGRLRGGWVPPGGEVVLLWIEGGGRTTYTGHLYANQAGQFHSSYTFFSGRGTVSYRLWASTARESDYPYAPASSRKVPITVSP